MNLGEAGSPTPIGGPFLPGPKATSSSGLPTNNPTYTGTLTGPNAVFTGNGAASVSPVTLTGTPFAGTGTTSTPLFYTNNSGTAPTTFGTGGTYWGGNAASNSFNLIDWHVAGGGSVFSVNGNGGVTTAANFVAAGVSQINNTGAAVASNATSGYAFSSTTASGGTQDTFITRAGPGNPRFGQADAASPVAQIISVQGVVAGTTDGAGAATTYRGSQSTGAGVGGPFQFQISTHGSTGSAQNSYGTKLTISEAGVTANGNLVLQGPLTGNSGRTLISQTVPTIGSGFGTLPTIPGTNGTAVFTVNVGTGGSATSGVITMPTAANGWGAIVNNLTSGATLTASVTAQSATSITISSFSRTTGLSTAFNASDILQVIAFAY